MAEVLLRCDATEACGTVYLLEVTIFYEKESMFMEILVEFKYHDIFLRLDLGVRFSPRVVFLRWNVS